MPIGKPVQIEAPLGLPQVPIAPDNPPTEENALARRLYYDAAAFGRHDFLRVLSRASIRIFR
jgi:hypothetical protein